MTQTHIASKEQVLQVLREALPDLRRRYGVVHLALFGSVVRGEQTTTSDIDLLVDLDESATLFDLVGLGDFLEEQLGHKVDVVPRRALRPEIRDQVLRDSVAV